MAYDFIQERDQEHLRTLALFYWACAAFDLIQTGVQIFNSMSTTYNISLNGMPAIPVFTSFAMTMMGISILLPALHALTGLLAGWWLLKTRHRNGILIIALLHLPFFTAGTVLGILTFVLFERDSVRVRFGLQKQSATPERPPLLD